MAENDPRSITKAPGFSTWGSVGVPKENAFYDLLDETKEKTDAFFESIMAIFDLVNTFLDFIASLLIDFTNPLKPIIEEIIAILEAFIKDLRNLGLYYTYDFKELKNPTEELLGGYLAFEQRMVMKLLNQSDPTRPDFTDKTKVFAMTFFAGADGSSIAKIIAYIKKLIKFFTPGSDESAKAPINLQAVYYNDFIGEVELPSSYTPDGIRLKWNLPPPSSTMPALPKSFVNPDYFLIIASTRNSRDTLRYIKKVPKSPDDPTISDGDGFVSFGDLVNKKSTEHLMNAHFWPLLQSDDGPLSLTKLKEGTTYDPLPKTPVDIGEGGSWVIETQDSRIHLNHIDNEPFSDLYKVFLFGGNPDSIIGDNDFSFDIPFDNLKIQNQLKDEYHITMYSLEIEDEDFNNTTFDKTELSGLFRVGTQWEVKSADLLYSFPDQGYNNYTVVSDGSLSLPSQTISVVAPTDLKTKYLNAIRFFFLAYYLGRLDEESNQKMAHIDPLTETELKFLGKYVDEFENDNYPTNYLYLTQADHAQQVIKWIDRVMLNFKFNIPKDSLLVPHLSTLNKIANFKYNLYEQLVATANGVEGEGIYHDKDMFKFKTGIDPDQFGQPTVITREEYDKNYAPYEEATFSHAGLEAGTTTFEEFEDFRGGQFFTNPKVWSSGGPILYFPDGDLRFFGEFIFIKDFVKNYKLVRPLVLLSGKTKETGQWKAIRPFRDMDLSALLNVIDLVKKFLEGVLKSLQGIVAQILKYIHILKVRIAQVQEIVRKIKKLIDLILSIRFPAGLYGTFHLADGTAGLVNSLTQSVDKPDIGVNGYGTGFMTVMGGVPSILIDLFIALMGGNSQEEE